MRPYDLKSGIWNKGIAVFESCGFDARVTADGKRMWFRTTLRHSFIDVTIPIKDFRKAIAFVASVDAKKLTREAPSKGARCGSHYVEVVRSFEVRKNGKLIWRKFPTAVLFGPIDEKAHHCVVINLTLCRRIIRWYTSEI